ncbi:hypothetical protein BCR32DRAFT_265340 [Anaeromyces robustus]|uniref:Knr4/Smi1-like domain-containing protein n=1 Tax=Anaeromyces robustus TaxID=1754192 RepID=A0A1Y1XJI8_9FUNG|nr:hypothetical protein BCR32DRAFT_265340 [Anaeromyces robustus]|eukprot:ORX85910.1 hypothetical protein BCR32DRAFT_265340 [Anaeromyces robustus]
MLILKESGNKLNEDSFKKIEKKLGIQFPQDYINFMLEHNGGRPIKSLSYSFQEKDPETNKYFDNNSDIYSFNKLEDIPTFYDNLVSSELIPNFYCPIADDSCGNEVLLCLDQSKHHENIFFADHELCDKDEHWVLVKVADSFSHFLNILNEKD